MKFTIIIKNIIVFSIFQFIFSIASAGVYENCKATAELLNKSTPTQIDSVTKLMSAMCIPEPSGKPRLVYYMEVDLPNVNQMDIDTLKPKMQRAWCTDPRQSRTLKDLDIRYVYRKNNGQFIGSINLSYKSC